MSRKALRTLSKREAESKELTAGLFGESDRAAALIGATMLENALRELLESGMRHNLTNEEKRAIFVGEGFLSRFSSKIKLAYALNLITPQLRFDVDLVREIRNAFAHSVVPLEFETPEIKNVCSLLSFYVRKKYKPSPRDAYIQTIMYSYAWIIQKSFDDVSTDDHLDKSNLHISQT
jgi:DNA-binding MltR family transcriptional regulator